MRTATRGFGVLVGSVTLGVVLWSASMACSGGSSVTQVTPVCQTDAALLGCIGITLTASADGPFTFTLLGQIFTSTGGNGVPFVGLSPGTYEVSGRMSTPNLRFALAGRPSTVPGGVVPTSLQSLQGPLLATPGRCAIAYLASGTTPPPQDFRFRFTVGATPPTC